MNHRRFDHTLALPRQEPPLATVATNATVLSLSQESVATVASVAPPSLCAHCAGDTQTVASETALAKAICAAEDWQAYFDERAAIREFSSGMTRTEAELLALGDVLMHLSLRDYPSS
jgi:hypothetical protein